MERFAETDYIYPGKEGKWEEDGGNEDRKGQDWEMVKKGRNLVGEWGEEENEEGWLSGAHRREVEERKAADGAQ